jgi:hypothetical protein
MIERVGNARGRGGSMVRRPHGYCPLRSSASPRSARKEKQSGAAIASKGTLAGPRVAPLLSTGERGRNGGRPGEAPNPPRPVKPHREPVGLPD